MFREITIGRSPGCDIAISPQYTWVSSRHAVVYYDAAAGTLMLRDTSRNGTVVNGQRVNNQAVPLTPGSVVMLAGNVGVPYESIARYFTGMPSPMAQPRPAEVVPASADLPDETFLRSWNWGAFLLLPYWCFNNGCWWMIFLVWAWPIPNIIFGITGTRWAWTHRLWESFSQFRTVQQTWSTVGITMFLVGLAMLVVYLLFFFILVAPFL